MQEQPLSNDNSPQYNLLTDYIPVDSFTEKYADKFKPSQVRWLARFRHTNGLQDAGVIVIVSRRMYINEKKFGEWFAKQIS